jgi:hypothetical protein
LDFIAYSGGMFGLFLGFSILSFVEIIFYYTINLIFNVWRRRKENLNEKKENYLQTYLKNSSVHGMNQIYGLELRHFVEKFFWIFCVLSSVFYSLYLSWDIFEKYAESTIVLSYDPNERSVESVKKIIIDKNSSIFNLIFPDSISGNHLESRSAHGLEEQTFSAQFIDVAIWTKRYRRNAARRWRF